MVDPNQLETPEAFTAIYLTPGGYKPSLPRDELFARYEFCEDLANMLTEHASNVKFDTGATEGDVLERIREGLLQPESGVNADEAVWVTGRLAELLNWPQLQNPESEPEP